MQRTLSVRVEAGPDGVLRLLAPRVGRWSEPPPNGSCVGPASRIGRLWVTGRRYDLIVPPGVAGRVERAPERRLVAVDYGAELCRLTPLGVDPALGERSPRPSASPGGRPLVAPTAGVFYRRAAPDLPPFVEVGSRVRVGQPVGMVEVMKTFHQILYGGENLPEEGEIVEIRAADASEVQAGDVLLVVR